MTALSSIEYQHWLIIAGAFLVALGLVGLALNRGVKEESGEIVGDQEPSKPEAELDHVEVYNETAKRKRRDRWAERFEDSEQPVEKLGQGANERHVTS